jgi:hypothetical protein
MVIYASYAGSLSDVPDCTRGEEVTWLGFSRLLAAAVGRRGRPERADWLGPYSQHGRQGGTDTQATVSQNGDGRAIPGRRGKPRASRESCVYPYGGYGADARRGRYHGSGRVGPPSRRLRCVGPHLVRFAATAHLQREGRGSTAQ